MPPSIAKTCRNAYIALIGREIESIFTVPAIMVTFSMPENLAPFSQPWSFALSHKPAAL
jgi:hypothetical protein